MKKGGNILLILTIVFVGFVAGMLVGRNVSAEAPTIQVLAEQTPTKTQAELPEQIEPTEDRININTASAKLLDTLPGIGPVLAQRIVDYRTQNGPFTRTSDLSRVEGIGPETLLSILDLITVEE